MAQPHGPLYTASDLFMLRAPVLPADTFPNLAGRPAIAADLATMREAGRERIRALTADARVRQALHAASPSLVATLPDVNQSGHDPSRALDASGARAGRRYSTLLRYLTRMSTRPTPLGLFAGVGIGTFSDDAAVVLARAPIRLTRTRADRAWLAQVVEQLDADPGIRDSLRVRVNALLYRVGDVAVLCNPDERKGASDERVELRINGPTAIALELARFNPTFGDLVAGLGQRFPGVPQDKIRGLLNRLWDAGVLRSDLLPSSTEPLPEVHLLKLLIDQDAAATVVDGLNRMRQLADEVDSAAGRADLASLDRLADHQRAMTPTYTERTYQLDTALAMESATLPHELGTTAAQAAELLARLGCLNPRRAHLVDYHREFFERYGVDSELPLLHVLNPETGIGPPNSYLKPPRRQPWPEYRGPQHDQRDRALVDLALRASHHGQREVELDDDLVEALTVWRPDDENASPRTSLDLFVQVAAGSAEALRDGRWRLVPSTVGIYGGWQGLGRFFDLFDAATVERIRAQQRVEEALRPDTVFAELNYVPRRSRGANLASHPATRRYEICVNTAPTGPPVRQLALDDIVLGATADRFYLRSTSLGRELAVSQTHAMNYTLTPNVCRALLEFSADGFTPLYRFDWGVLADAPFLPRLTRGKVVVHPAQWTITVGTFPEPGADPDHFYRACQQWRERWHVPRYVYLTDQDNRLLLDLDHPLWVDELYREVVRRRAQLSPQAIQLQEVLPGPTELWLRDGDDRRYHAELVVPLVLRDRSLLPEPLLVRASSPPAAPRAAPPPATPRAAPPPATPRAAPPLATTRRLLPGAEWLHLKLYAAPEQHDALIVGPLRSLVTELRAGLVSEPRAGDARADEARAGNAPADDAPADDPPADKALVDRWFFIRYADPLPHLRLRFHAAHADRMAELMHRCATWGRELVEHGQATDVGFASYDRELERYGGAHAIEAVETAFSANSDAAIDLVHLLHHGTFDADVMCVAALQALYRSWGAEPRPARAGRDVPADTRQRFREFKPLLCEVLAPGERRPDPRAPHHRAALTPILDRQHRALAAAGERVRELAARGLLTGSEENVIGSLAHIQSIRLVGLDRPREELAHDLWALARRAIRNRPPAATTSSATVGATAPTTVRATATGAGT